MTKIITNRIECMSVSKPPGSQTVWERVVANRDNLGLPRIPQLNAYSVPGGPRHPHLDALQEKVRASVPAQKAPAASRISPQFEQTAKALLTGPAVALTLCPVDRTLAKMAVRPTTPLFPTIFAYPYRGIGPKIANSFINYAVVMEASPQIRAVLEENLPGYTHVALGMAGYGAGSVLATAATAPLSTITARMSVHDQKLPTVLAELYKEGKISLLYAGSGAVFVRDAITHAILFPVAEEMMNALRRDNPNMSDLQEAVNKIFAFTAAGSLAMPLSHPFAVLATRQRITGQNLMQTVQAVGFKNLYAGITTAFPRMFMANAIVGCVAAGVGQWAKHTNSRSDSPSAPPASEQL